MGLDMYLTRKVYIGAEYEHRKVTGTIDIQIDGKPVDIEFKKVSYIEERAAYWRKANQIHNWFVQNVQGGVDECQPSDVSIEQLRELVTMCKQILEQKDKPKKLKKVASEVLPTASGCFFGGTDYDEYYIQELEDTVEQLEPYITDEKYKWDDFEYRASW